MSTFKELANILISSENKSFGVGASEDEIRAAEEELGIPITGGFRNYLLQFGWGGVDSIELYGLGKGVPLYLNLVSITISEREEMYPNLRKDLLPVLNDGAGNLYCMDTSIAKESPVVFWDHEAGPDQIPEIEAPGFTEWLMTYIKNATD